MPWWVDWKMGLSGPAVASRLTSAVFTDACVVIISVDSHFNLILTRAHSHRCQAMYPSRKPAVHCDMTKSCCFFGMNTFSRSPIRADNWVLSLLGL